MNLHNIPTHQVHLVFILSNNQITKIQVTPNITSSLMELEFYHLLFTSFIIIVKFVVEVVIIKINKIIVIINVVKAIQVIGRKLNSFIHHLFLI